MVKFYSSLNEDHIEFITNQSLFFVASAPWAGDHINISPKGHPSRTFAVLGPNTVAYLDATGSGCETIAHVYENGRATLLFSSFGAKPRVMRLFCKARVVEKWDPYYGQLRAKMATENGDEIDITGARAIIVLKVNKIQTSCGFKVPEGASTEDAAGDAVTYADHDDGADAADGFAKNDTMEGWARKTLEKQELGDYQKRYNHRSLDGLPGMMSARRSHDENIAVEDTKAWFRKVSRQQDAVALGVGLGVLLMLLLSFVGILSIKPIFLEHILNFQRRQMGEPEDHSWKSEL
ncbi:pyridoxamine phosphate oxidase family [Pyrenophora seminiperda CCB06]|uniref:Pyridoxamine phosphate oxidase family n=1 Tax=Pyrenophora seminiperda CCB06 TaxID=1302712 RepID=A0A3M7M3Y5_9PLEO|nr:pyridoxamine phosphate oxidase family [Pyrenophora seminiperda CCB06]